MCMFSMWPVVAKFIGFMGSNVFYGKVNLTTWRGFRIKKQKIFLILERK